MTKPIIRIHDQETNETIDREMTDSEFAAYSQELSEIQAEEAAQLAAKEAVESKLAALGLTTEDLVALGLIKGQTAPIAVE
jgi:hypothetical protein